MTGQELLVRWEFISNQVFGVSHRAYLESHSGRQFWGLSANLTGKKFLPLFGSPPVAVIAKLPFAESQAGYRVDLSSRFPALNVNVDVFLINAELLNDPTPEMDALLIHEMCHWLIDSNEPQLDPMISVEDQRVGERVHRVTDYWNEAITRHDL